MVLWDVMCVGMVWFIVVRVDVVYRAVTMRLQHPGWLVLSCHSIGYGHHGGIQLGWDLGQAFQLSLSAPFCVIHPYVRRSVWWCGAGSISEFMFGFSIQGG